MKENKALPDVVLLSTADWNNPFWTNKQHVAAELERRGHKVLYIESLGLRRPSASAQDFKRLWSRLVKGVTPPRQMRERLWVWSPLVIPLQRYAWVRAANRFLLSMGLSLWTRVLGIKRDLLWTYNPLTTDFINVRRFGSVVYHCVDDIAAQPGMPGATIERAEACLLKHADLCFVTAETLLEKRRAQNPRTYYFGNVADYEHFAKARNTETAVPADLASLPEPRVGFIGAISGYKLDFGLLRRLAEVHPDWSIVLIGKVGEGDPWTDVRGLQGLRNLHFLGARSYGTLPAYLKGFQVAILPSVINDYTRCMFPMKFFEYLAAGCPVVSTDLPALQKYAHVARLAAGPDAFIASIERCLAGEAPPLESRLSAAKEQTYERRTASMMEMLANLP